MNDVVERDVIVDFAGRELVEFVIARLIIEQL